MPYEQITDETYEEMMKDLKPIDFEELYKKQELSRHKQDPEKENYCDNDSCKI